VLPKRSPPTVLPAAQIDNSIQPKRWNICLPQESTYSVFPKIVVIKTKQRQS